MAFSKVVFKKVGKKLPRQIFDEIEEEVKDVVGFGGRYAVSMNGNIWSLVRRDISRFTMLRSVENSHGYLMVHLYDDKGKGHLYTIHRLVALTWIPNEEGKICVNHKDGVKKNNAVGNLEWCSYSENMIHAFKTGLMSGKKDAPHSVLTVEDVIKARELRASGMRLKEIADIYGVTCSAISLTVKRTNWKSVA